jgi:hypothetical protein
MSYPRLFEELPTKRFAGLICARGVAANYHGLTIARLLALKLGSRPRAMLSYLPRPLAREAARALARQAGPGRPGSATLFLALLREAEGRAEEGDR